jgi:hypothetical protein
MAMVFSLSKPNCRRPAGDLVLGAQAVELAFQLPVSPPGFGEVAREVVQGGPKAAALVSQRVVDGGSVPADRFLWHMVSLRLPGRARIRQATVWVASVSSSPLAPWSPRRFGPAVGGV